MNNRINQLFAQKKDNILSIYFTAGYPNLNNTEAIIKNLTEAGADLIEIGIPFSDPMADGPTIQQSSQQALDNGMSLKLLFEQIQSIRSQVDTPLILMGYLNPILQYGIKRFCKKCKEVGIDGLIFPDLPMIEYEEEYQPLFAENNLHNIFLITPQTSDQRIRKIDALSSGFIYMVAAAATTGAKQQIAQSQQAYFERINAMNLSNPRLIGFGISNHETYAKACRYANGVIIGSAFIKHIADTQNDELPQHINDFVQKIRQPETVNI